ncbi:MAG: bifunctional [glutamate--ammonia ligase]-adenylyl-L-tyrosine phosphorylase/[glutamate--ammonia-ligase] adenylyltransferase [Verrucomicrobiae bacterium]|nr:bifunctional [glutamate--ammonia ligase]-adenylyl-L-tyrosine phosphorylase/[glutamate--ammonia-ligase] adenylyltransferase [Verrucomicrobiae bacterium]
MTTDTLRTLAAAAPDPALASNHLIRLGEALGSEPWPEVLDTHPHFAKALVHLLGYSVPASNLLICHPVYLPWLLSPEMRDSPRSAPRLRAEFSPGGPATTGTEPKLNALRTLKEREMLRIAFRDLGGLASFAETVHDLSLLADVCVQRALEILQADFDKRLGARPPTPFSVIALGKLGGQELNFHSDIDIIYVYEAEGDMRPGLTHHEYFTRLAQSLTHEVSRKTAEGQLFRVDLRLRPEGESGPIVRSLESYENYYAAFGETWERMMLQKARHMAGDAELSYGFIQSFQSFCHPRHRSGTVLAETARLKARIEREVVGSERIDRHVKLGAGGIREIEFIVQVHQLLDGAHQPLLQSPQTLKVLGALHALGIMSREDFHDLRDAYVFLRTVEHRLQLAEYRQTHTIPADPAAQTRLACSLGFCSGSLFWETLEKHTGRVRHIFTRTFAQHAPEQNQEADLTQAGFWDVETAGPLWNSLRDGRADAHVGPRVRQNFERLSPVLLHHLRSLGNPDLALGSLERFVEVYGSRAPLYDTFASSPKVLELLLRVFDSSRFLTDVLLRRPGLFEEVARGGELDTLKSVADFSRDIQAFIQKENFAGQLRLYRRGEIFRIALRDLMGLAPLADLTLEYSNLAGACLQAVVCTERDRHHEIPPLSVIALGKFGGHELSYGSDLDLLFVGGSPAMARSILAAMTRQTSEGIVFPADARLRPEGEAGELTLPLAGYGHYFSGRAQTWERQSLLRARCVAGDESLGRAFLQFAESEIRKLKTDPAKTRDDFASMRRRIEEARGGDGEYDLKCSAGGLLDLEFLTQYLQILHDVREPNTLEALAQIAERGGISPGELVGLRDAYLFLRRVEITLRRFENSPVSKLPRADRDMAILLRRLGTSPDDFWTPYRAHRKMLRESYTAHLFG